MGAHRRGKRRQPRAPGQRRRSHEAPQPVPGIACRRDQRRAGKTDRGVPGANEREARSAGKTAAKSRDARRAAAEGDAEVGPHPRLCRPEGKRARHRCGSERRGRTVPAAFTRTVRRRHGLSPQVRAARRGIAEQDFLRQRAAAIRAGPRMPDAGPGRAPLGRPLDGLRPQRQHDKRSRCQRHAADAPRDRLRQPAELRDG